MKKKVLFVKVRDVETGKFWSTRSRDFTKVGHFIGAWEQQRMQCPE